MEEYLPCFEHEVLWERNVSGLSGLEKKLEVVLGEMYGVRRPIGIPGKVPLILFAYVECVHEERRCMWRCIGHSLTSIT
jgi:hypothetical protein